MTRLFFFASFIPDRIAKTLQNELSDILDPSLRCVLPTQYHQTFYPPFPCSDLKRLMRSVTDRFELFSPSSLSFTELSLGPSLTDLRLIWVKGQAWKQSHPYQYVLTEAIVEANKGNMEGVLSSANLFLPHITLGRFLSVPAPQFFEPKPISLSFSLPSLALVETVRSALGSRYHIHAEWSLL